MKNKALRLLKVISACLFLLASGKSNAQTNPTKTKILQGQIVDEEGEPYAYAGVWSAGKSVITDNSGFFEIRRPADCARYGCCIWFQMADEFNFNTMLEFNDNDTGKRLVFKVIRTNPGGLSRSDIKHMQGYDMTRIIASTGNMLTSGRNNNISISGARPENTIYMIDGIMIYPTSTAYYEPPRRRNPKQ